MSEQTQEQAFDPGLVEQWERTEFEKLIPSARIQWDSLNHRYRDKESGFADSSIQSAWVVWKARAILAAAPSLPAPDIAQPLDLGKEREKATEALYDETDGPGWDDAAGIATYYHKDLCEWFVRGWLAALGVKP